MATFLLQIRVKLFYKSMQLFYYCKLGENLLQIAAGITSWSKLLQIRAQQLECVITKENLFKNVFQGFGNILEGVFARIVWYCILITRVSSIGKAPTVRNLKHSQFLFDLLFEKLIYNLKVLYSEPGS